MNQAVIYIDLDNFRPYNERTHNEVMKYFHSMDVLLKFYGSTEQLRILPTRNINSPYEFIEAKKVNHFKNSTDHYIHRDAQRDLYEIPSIKLFVICSGDSDYIPLIEEIKRLKKQTWLLSTNLELNIYLKLAVDRIIQIQDTVKTYSTVATQTMVRPISSKEYTAEGDEFTEFINYNFTAKFCELCRLKSLQEICTCPIIKLYKKYCRFGGAFGLNFIKNIKNRLLVICFDTPSKTFIDFASTILNVSFIYVAYNIDDLVNLNFEAEYNQWVDACDNRDMNLSMESYLELRQPRQPVSYNMRRDTIFDVPHGPLLHFYWNNQLIDQHIVGDNMYMLEYLIDKALERYSQKLLKATQLKFSQVVKFTG